MKGESVRSTIKLKQVKQMSRAGLTARVYRTGCIAALGLFQYRLGFTILLARRPTAVSGTQVVEQ